jgi:hypothetical protein
VLGSGTARRASGSLDLAAHRVAPGTVSYLEIAAFVDRAKESIPNERFRSHVLARAPVRLRLRAGMRLAYLRRHGRDREYTLRPPTNTKSVTTNRLYRDL